MLSTVQCGPPPQTKNFAYSKNAKYTLLRRP